MVISSYTAGFAGSIGPRPTHHLADSRPGMAHSRQLRRGTFAPVATKAFHVAGSPHRMRAQAAD
jgi:hypothetical protein